MKKAKIKKRLAELEKEVRLLWERMSPSETVTSNIEIHFDEVTEGLPEKWAVALTDDNYQILHKGYASPCGYHHSDMVSTNNWSLQLKDGYTEITFETFKKYVLKEEVKGAQPEPIDFSKAGQLVESKKWGCVIMTSGKQTPHHFTGTYVVTKKDDIGKTFDSIIKEGLILCTEPVTLKNE